jgi:AcrR family transcriptional regulator
MEKAGKRRKEPHQAVLKAAFSLLARVGYAGITMDGLAKEAGVGKPTLYRWWSSKAEILLEAVTADAQETLPAPHTGSLRGDLEAYLVRLFELLAAGGAAIARSLIAEAGLDVVFAQRFRETFIASRRAEVLALLERAAGELRPGASLETLADAFFGPVWYRLMLHETLGPDEAAAMVDQFLDGAARKNSPRMDADRRG